MSATSPTSPIISVTDFRSNKLIRTLNVDGVKAPRVALSPDGKTLAVTEKQGITPLSGACTLRFIDLASGQARDVDVKGHVAEKLLQPLEAAAANQFAQGEDDHVRLRLEPEQAPRLVEQFGREIERRPHTMDPNLYAYRCQDDR